MQQFLWKPLFSFLILCLAGPCMAENQMEFMWYAGIEPGNEGFGYNMTSMDFNGDGIDDLLVGAYGWYPPDDSIAQGRAYGKIYFYFGGASFSNQPDTTWESHSHIGLGRQIENLGDMNGDGYDDLGSVRSDPDFDIRAVVDVYYGGPDADSVPDFSYFLYFEDAPDPPIMHGLGDVNGDGFDDAGLAWESPSATNRYEFYLLYGGADSLQVSFFAHLGPWHTSECGFSGSINAAGDVNNDGYDDMLIKYRRAEDPPWDNRRGIFLGGTPPDTFPDFEICNIGLYYASKGKTCGNFNGLGGDDLVPYSSFDAGYLWYGDAWPLSTDADIELESAGRLGEYQYGDLNGDGYDDICYGDPDYAASTGHVTVNLGGAHANGSCDLAISWRELSDCTPDIFVLDGIGKAIAVADFNDDGYDDLAIGTTAWGGLVHVFAGNGQLTDVTPEAAENCVPQLQVVPALTAYPNPFNPEIKFEIQHSAKLQPLSIQIFNIKGQLVETLHVSGSQFTWHAQHLASGIYLCKLMHNDHLIDTQKITLLK